jgi:hypothetical protein
MLLDQQHLCNHSEATVMTVRCSASLRRSLEYLSIHMHNKSLNLKGRVIHWWVCEYLASHGTFVETSSFSLILHRDQLLN